MLYGTTRAIAANNTDSQLFYSFSTDAGVTWSPNVAVSDLFNPIEGYPNQNKIGDYITIVSDNTGGNVAYSATFNFNPSRGQHEEDVYYVRVFPSGGGTPTPTPTASPTATPTATAAQRQRPQQRRQQRLQLQPTATATATATATSTATATPTLRRQQHLQQPRRQQLRYANSNTLSPRPQPLHQLLLRCYTESRLQQQPRYSHINPLLLPGPHQRQDLAANAEAAPHATAPAVIPN